MDEYDQMRVVDLQLECKKHGLDHKGKKHELIDRLRVKSASDSSALSTDLCKQDNAKSDESCNDLNEQEPASDKVDLTTTEEPDVKDGCTDNEAKTPESHSSNSEFSRKRADRSVSKERSGSRSPPVTRRRRSATPECVVPAVHIFNSVNLSQMHLNSYTADLNLSLSDDCLSTHINSDPDLNSLHACVSGSHYIPLPNEIKVGYTVKLNDLNAESDRKEFECLIGWTLDDNNNQHCLDEKDINSFLYCSNGKKYSNLEFNEFFESFSTGDTITSLASFSNGSLSIQFAKNGKLCDIPAFTIPEDKLNPQPSKLCPQIFIRNCSFEVNFGQSPGDMVEDFLWIDSCDLKQQCIVGTDNKSDYEVILMVGLPASGKSYQVAKLIEDNCDKHYCVISSEKIENRYKYLSEKTENLSYDRKEQLSLVLSRIVEEAPRRPRNYIIDTCNITREIQRKILGPFKGFHRKAIIVIPEDTVYQQRLLKSDCSKISVLEMKATMSLPSIDDVDELSFAELDAEEASQLVEKYNKEGHSAKRRSERSPRNYDRYSRRSSPRSRDQRQHSSQRSRYGSSRREWRNDTSRMDANRFQPRRSSPQFNKRSGMNAGGGYDYGRFYGSDQRLPSYSGSQGMYGRQRRSISPTLSRQQSNMVGGSWNFSPAGNSQSAGTPFRQRSYDPESGNGGHYRSMGVGGMHGPRSSGPAEFHPSKFAQGNRMPAMKNTSGPMSQSQWNRDSSSRNFGPQRAPLIQHSGGPRHGLMNASPSSNSSALIHEGPKQARQMEHWQLSGKRDRSSGGMEPEWQQAKPNFGQRAPGDRQWRGNAPNANTNQQQWPPTRPSINDQFPAWPRQPLTSTMGPRGMWPRSSNMPNTRSNYPQQITPDTRKSTDFGRKSREGSSAQPLHENWPSSERRMSSSNDNWESSEKSGYNDQSKWSRNSNDWQSPQQPKAARMQWPAGNKVDRWSSDMSQQQNPERSWSDNSFTEQPQKWNNTARVSTDGNQWGNMAQPNRPVPSTINEQQQQDWSNSTSVAPLRGVDSTTPRGAWQSQRPQYPTTATHPTQQNPNWQANLKPSDDQMWSRPSQPSATSYPGPPTRHVDPTYGSPRQPYRMYPPQGNTSRMPSSAIPNNVPPSQNNPQAWSQQMPVKPMRPSSAPQQTQNFSQNPRVPAQPQMRPPAFTSGTYNRLPQSMMMQPSPSSSSSPIVPGSSTTNNSVGAPTSAALNTAPQNQGSWNTISNASTAVPSTLPNYYGQQQPSQQYQAAQTMVPQRPIQPQYQQQIANTQQSPSLAATTPLQQYNAALQQQYNNQQQQQPASAVAAAWAMPASSKPSSTPVVPTANVQTVMNSAQYGTPTTTMRPVNTNHNVAKPQIGSVTTSIYPNATNTAAYNYSQLYAAQQAAAAYNQSTANAQPTQQATVYQANLSSTLQTPNSYQLAAAAAAAASAHQANYPTTANNAATNAYPYSAITGNSSAPSATTMTSAQVSNAAGMMQQQQASVTPSTTPTANTANTSTPSAQTATATGTATTQQHQMIDEPTAYAGYLSAGYDQATAKAMATAYVQQQQQYYQWHQQWAAAAAVASSAQAAATGNSSSSTVSTATNQQSQQMSSSIQK